MTECSCAEGFPENGEHEDTCPLQALWGWYA